MADVDDFHLWEREVHDTEARYWSDAAIIFFFTIAAVAWFVAVVALVSWLTNR